MPEAPEGSIIITPKEFYDGVKTDVEDIKKAVGDVASALAPLPERVAKLESQVEILDRRADLIDRKLAYWSGAAACLGALAGTFLPRLFS